MLNVYAVVEGRWSCGVSILVKQLSTKFHENNWSSFWVRHTCRQMDVASCHIFTIIHCKHNKQLHRLLVLCSRNFLCIGKFSVHFLAMHELWRKSSVGTDTVLLSICYHFSIWLGICTDLTSFYDTWPYPKRTWTHWADCHQVRFHVGVVHQVSLISVRMLAAWMVAIHNALTSNLMQITSICVN